MNLNAFLEGAGLDLAQTRLVRHKDTRAKVPTAPYALWAAGDARFETYQRLQSKARFSDTRWLVSFVVTPENQTVLAGVYEVDGAEPSPPVDLCPVRGTPVSDHLFYDLKRTAHLLPFVGRLVIDWGPAAISWVQWAGHDDKAVIEILREPVATPAWADEAQRIDRGATGGDPDWSRDEHILALDLYITNPASPPGKASAAVVGLSKLLNRLGERLGVRRSAKYRNPNGVYMKLMNFRRLDPAVLQEGKKVLSRAAKGEEAVWAEFHQDRAALSAAAAAIRLAVEDGTVELGASSDYEADETGVVFRLHRSRERDRKLIETKKREAMARHGELRCEVCAFEFSERYGSLGQDFIEAHHRKPVSTLIAGEKTKLSDLALVCANCHRMLHRRGLALSLDELKAKLVAG